MEARQQKTLARFGQVLTFLDANTSVITPSAVAGQRQVLASAVTQITGFAQDQIVRGTESVLSQTVSSARTALRDTFMRQLSTVGLHSLTGKQPTDPIVPQAAQIFALPDTHTNASVLIQSATAMVAAATPYASIFTGAGVNLDAVNAAIQSLQAAVNTEANAKRISEGATKGIVAQIQAGHGAVRMMDVVIRPLLATNKPLLSQWDSVKRAAGGLNLAAPVPVPAASSQQTSTQPASTPSSTTAAPASTAATQSDTTAAPTPAATQPTTASAPAAASTNSQPAPASTPATAPSSAPATAGA